MKSNTKLFLAIFAIAELCFIAVAIIVYVAILVSDGIVDHPVYFKTLIPAQILILLSIIVSYIVDKILKL